MQRSFSLVSFLNVSTGAVTVMVIAMATAQAGLSPIEAATRRHGRIFAIYIVALVLTALLIAFLTWLVWDSGNKVQDVIQADADARIQEARLGVAQLQSDNLKLGRDLEDEKGKVANLQTDAANAKTAQANAERALLELQERNKPRHLSAAQQQQIAAKLRAFAPQKANLFAYSGDNEIVGITNDLIASLSPPTGAAWTVNVFTGTEVGRAIGNILIEVKPDASPASERAANALALALREVALTVYGPQPSALTGSIAMGTGKSDPDAEIKITVGKKI